MTNTTNSTTLYGVYCHEEGGSAYRLYAVCDTAKQAETLARELELDGHYFYAAGHTVAYYPTA